MASWDAAGRVVVEVLFGIHAPILAHAFAEGKGGCDRRPSLERDDVLRALRT